MAKTKNNAKTVKIVFWAMGLIFLTIGGVISLFAYDFMNNALPATGTVVSVEVNYGDDSVTYKPTIRFIDYEGSKQSGETWMSSSSYNFEVGSKVDILYDVRDPSSLRMNTWFATWGFGIIFLIGAFVPIFVAFLIGLFSKRKPRDSVETAPAKESKYANPDPEVEEEMIEVRARTKGLISRESRSDHERETSYTPTVRRNR